MSGGSGEEEASASSGTYRRDLLPLKLRPIAGPFRSMISRAAASWSGEPMSVLPSRYHEFRARPGDLFSYVFNDWGEESGRTEGGRVGPPVELRSSSYLIACD